MFELAKSPLGDLIVGLAFGKFSGLLPVNKIKETDKVIAFWHPKPYWEKHILIVPKKAIRDLTSLNTDEIIYVNEVFNIAQEIIKEFGWEKTDYTLITNGGTKQEIHQLHFHLGNGKIIDS